METPSIKSGNVKELRLLHDTVNQHVRSLRAIKGDTVEAFVSSSVEMKLDRASKFAWQQSLIEFIDDRAQAWSHPANQAAVSIQRRKRETKTRTSYQITTERNCVGPNYYASIAHLKFICGIIERESVGKGKKAQFMYELLYDRGTSPAGVINLHEGTRDNRWRREVKVSNHYANE